MKLLEKCAPRLRAERHEPRDLLAAARDARRRGEYSQLEERLAEARLVEVGEGSRLGHALLATADLHLRRGHWFYALDTLQPRLQALRTVPDDLRERYVLAATLSGEARMERQQLKSARELCRIALDQELPPLSPVVLRAKLLEVRLENRGGRAANQMAELVRLRRQIDSRDFPEGTGAASLATDCLPGLVYLELGRAQLQHGARTDAKAALTKADELARAAGDPLLSAQARFFQLERGRFDGQPPTELLAGLAALEQEFERWQAGPWKARVWELMAEVNGSLGRYTDALRLFGRAKQIYAGSRGWPMPAEFPRLLSRVMSKMGHIYAQVGDWTAALQYYERDVNTCRQTGIFVGKAHALRNLGRCQRLLEDLEGSRVSLKESASIFRRVGNRFHEAMTRLELAATIIQDRKGSGPAATIVQDEGLKGVLAGRGSIASRYRTIVNYALGRLALGRAVSRGSRPFHLAQAERHLLAAYDDLDDRNSLGAEVCIALANLHRLNGEPTTSKHFLFRAIRMMMSRDRHIDPKKLVRLVERIDPSLTTDALWISRLSTFNDEDLFRDLTDSRLDRPLGTPRVTGGAVLFADLRAFTRLCESMDLGTPLADILDEFMDSMVQAIEGNRGVVNKFVGDCVVGLFPTFGTEGEPPEPASMPALRAAQAAVEGLELLKLCNMRRQERGDPPLRVRIGLAMGHFLYGVFGKSRRRDLTAIGHTVNLASRIQGIEPDEAGCADASRGANGGNGGNGAAQPSEAEGTILAGGEIGAELERSGRFLLRKLSDTHVRNLTDAIPLWQLLGRATS
ncbi:MAG: hypothetical protein HYZ53_20640 [Planctomycetes bacterium]|nr:hypothetical protein [Planctomycetota bacterium]